MTMSEFHDTLETIDSETLLIVLRHAPHGSSWLKEGIDVALVAAAFGRPTALLFQGDGVYALLDNQSTGAMGQKGTHPQLAMLEMYDIDQLWASADALRARGLKPENLMLPVTPLSAADVATLLRSHARCLVF